MVKRLHVVVGQISKGKKDNSWISEAAFYIMQQILKELMTNQPLVEKELGKQMRQRFQKDSRQ